MCDNKQFVKKKFQPIRNHCSNHHYNKNYSKLRLTSLNHPPNNPTIASIRNFSNTNCLILQDVKATIKRRNSRNSEPPSAACISSLNLFDPVLLSPRFLFDGIRNRLRSVTRHKWILYSRRINPSSPLPPISVDSLIRKLRRDALILNFPKKRRKKKEDKKKRNSHKFRTKPINSALFFFLVQECFKFKRVIE